VFDAGELAKAVELLVQILGPSKHSTITLVEYLSDGSSHQRHISIRELETVCDLATQNVRIFLSYDQESIMIRLSANYEDEGEYEIYISAASAQTLTAIRESLENSLKLEEPPERTEEQDPIALSINKLVGETMGPVYDRLEALEEKILSASRRLRCFLSYRFNDNTEVLSLRVQQFLAALDVEVLTGASYEPRQVSEKVLSRLREPLDFVVLLITSDGESMWTRDEIGAAIHKGIALVPIVQKGSRLQPGLFADVEYIEFETDHIGDAFLKLLQAVRFVREQSSTSINPNARTDGSPDDNQIM
jgi:hypothetical protein